MCNCSPFLSYPRWPLLHTLCLSHAVCAPQTPPPFFLFCSVFTCNVSECAMSFLLGSAASFTVDWFLFRSRGNGPPFPIILPSSLPSSPPPPGQAAGVGNGPDVRCMVDGRAVPGPRVPAARGEDGAVLAVCPPRPPASRSYETHSLRLPGTADCRSRAPTAPRVSVGSRPAVPGGGGLSLPGKSVAQCSSPLPALPPSDAHRRPHALRHDTAFVLLIW